MREGSIRGRPERDRERKAREVKVPARSSCEDRSIGKGEGNGWELGRAHEVCKRGEELKDMGSTGVGKDGRGGDRTQKGRMVTGVIVGIVRFQRSEGVRVRETRGWCR